jgi:hypothetical protein
MRYFTTHLTELTGEMVRINVSLGYENEWRQIIRPKEEKSSQAVLRVQPRPRSPGMGYDHLERARVHALVFAATL